MKIWIDPDLLLRCLTNDAERFESGCPGEDGCGCEANDEQNQHDYKPHVPTASVSITSAVQHIHHVYGHTFVCAATLYVQQCSDAHWIVCTPTGESRLAVLDTEAYRLLERFRRPQRLLDVITVETISQIERAIALFILAGFLQDLDQPAIVAEQKSAQTLSAWMHITNACNLHCSYCYVRKSAEHMADATAKRSVDAIIRSATAYHYRSIHLTFAGGEATLRLPEVIATYDYALQQTQEHGLGLTANIISNGAALPPRAIAQLRQRQMRLLISLDGVGAVHDQQRPLLNGQGSFTFVDRTIARLLAAGLVPYINVTVTRHNLDDLPNLLAYLLQRDLPFGLSYYRDNECSTHQANLQFTDAHMIQGMRAAFAYIEEHLPRRSLMDALVDKARTSSPRQYACGVGRHYMVIDQHGGVAKCQVDIRNTLTTIDTDNPLQVIKADRRGVQAVPIDEKQGCRSCEWRYWCSGGCPLLTYRLTGRSDIQSPNCAIYKALFPEALRLEALRLLKYEELVSLA